MPVYLATQAEQIVDAWPWIAVAAAGVIAGTLLGERLLRRIPEPVFRRVLGALILALGVVMFFEASR